jgi:hypothetical protein
MVPGAVILSYGVNKIISKVFSSIFSDREITVSDSKITQIYKKNVLTLRSNYDNFARNYPKLDKYIFVILKDNLFLTTIFYANLYYSGSLRVFSKLTMPLVPIAIHFARSMVYMRLPRYARPWIMPSSITHNPYVPSKFSLSTFDTDGAQEAERYSLNFKDKWLTAFQVLEATFEFFEDDRKSEAPVIKDIVKQAQLFKEISTAYPHLGMDIENNKLILQEYKDKNLETPSISCLIKLIQKNLLEKQQESKDELNRLVLNHMQNSLMLDLINVIPSELFNEFSLEQRKVLIDILFFELQGLTGIRVCNKHTQEIIKKDLNKSKETADVDYSSLKWEKYPELYEEMNLSYSRPTRNICQKEKYSFSSDRCLIGIHVILSSFLKHELESFSKTIFSDFIWIYK